MSGDWLTYRELADRLGVSVEAARRRALRARWARQSGNDGKARVHLPDDYEVERRPDGAPDVQPDASVTNAALVSALEAHVQTLKEQLAAAEGKACEETSALHEHVETLKAQLANAESRADEAIRASAAQLDLERARADKTIAAFQSLAVRLEEIAAARRPWWRRLVG